MNEACSGSITLACIGRCAGLAAEGSKANQNQDIQASNVLFLLSVRPQSYSMAVYLVKQQSSTVLLQRLRAKGIRNPDHSRALSKTLKPHYGFLSSESRPAACICPRAGLYQHNPAVNFHMLM